MKPIFLVGVICLLGVVGSANGQTVTRADSTLATDTQSQELLQAQIEVMREYDQKLLDTVYWSLGVIGGIAVLLLGFGWFVNFKVYERDKRSMQQELDSTLRREIAEAKEKQDELIREATKAIPDQIKDVVDDSLDGVRKDIETLSSNQVKSWEDFFRRFNDMEFELLELKADKWIKSKVLTNALRTLAQMIGVGSLRYSGVRLTLWTRCYQW